MMDRKARILVVDDDPNIKEIVRLVLEKQGYSVSLAKDGQEAVEVFLKEKPDMVISDVAMPRGDGFNVAILVRSRDLEGQRTPVLLMSAFYEEEANRANTERCGADAFLSKPFTHAQLIVAVEELLARKRPEVLP